MPKRKINVVSNELDQAPKTRAAGYGKVIDSMRKEINEAMDRIILNGSDVIADYMNHASSLPLKQLLELEPWKHLSFEVKRENNETTWWSATVWGPAFLWNFNNFTNNCLYFLDKWPLKPWETSLIIVVEKDANDPKIWKIHAEQLEYPWKWAMLMQWMFFHNPNVSDEKFQEIMWNSENEGRKDEVKEQIKENISEEIELEEESKIKEENEKKESKPEGKKEGKKKWFGETIKWWFK